MREFLPYELEMARRQHSLFPPTGHGDKHGYFQLVRNVTLNVISSGDFDQEYPDKPYWEHVSVSIPDRCPTWDEMCFVKDLFWDESETVIQFHPKRSEYVNKHEYCLHLWKPPGGDIQLPPSICVG